MHVIPEWLELISLSYCIGVIACRLWFFTPSMQDEFSFRGDFVDSMWRLFCYALAVIVGGSIVELLARTAEISGRPFPLFFPVLPTVLLKTHYGGVWLVRVASLTVLAIMKTATRYRDSRTFLLVMLFLGLAVSMTASASGHASDAGDFSLPEVMDFVHLIGASLWGGGLIAFSVSVLPGITVPGKMSSPMIARIASRFSEMAGVAVGLVFITAIYNAWSYVGRSGAAWGTTYGLLVVAKIVLFFILINLGAFNRYVGLPLLQEWGSYRKREGIMDRLAGFFFAPFRRNLSGEQAALRFRRAIGVEAVLIVAVLLCGALLRHEIPARHVAHMKHSLEKWPSHNENGGMHDHSDNHNH